jgi:bacterioferritin-associated ferredoxin
MIICICHGISDRHIAAQARAGCLSFDELQLDTGVATRCGCCREMARQTFEQHRAQAAGGSAAACASLQAAADATA